MRKVTKEEFDAFIASYPKPLERAVLRIGEPDKLQYNDWTLGGWPQSVVAQFDLWGCDPVDIFAEVPGNWMIESAG